MYKQSGVKLHVSSKSITELNLTGPPSPSCRIIAKFSGRNGNWPIIAGYHSWDEEEAAMKHKASIRSSSKAKGIARKRGQYTVLLLWLRATSRQLELFRRSKFSAIFTASIERLIHPNWPLCLLSDGFRCWKMGKVGMLGLLASVLLGPGLIIFIPGTGEKNREWTR